MIAVLAAAALAGGGQGGAAAEPGGSVAMAGRAFVPARITMLTGETLRWTNQDSVSHTVTELGGSFDSGRVGPGGTFARRFDAPGTFPYRCELHQAMRGAVDVVALALAQPDGAARAGRPARLEGRAPSGTKIVQLERVGDAVVSEATPDADGRFAFTVPAVGPASFRARAGSLSSAVLRLRVAPEVRLAARRGAHGVSVRIHGVGQPRALVILERHERERFGFVRLRRVRLDRHGRARAHLPTGRRLRLRARLALPVGGYDRSVSRVVVIPRATGVPVGEDGGHHR